MISTFPVKDLKFSYLPIPIQNHLKAHKKRLEPKPPGWGNNPWDGRKAGTYEWFETQDVIGYHKEFSKLKIIYPNMTKYLPFYLDDADRFFGNQKCFIITSETESLHYLIAVLNSSLFKCCFRDNFPELLGNSYELSKIFVEKIPIKKPTSAETALFQTLVQLAKTEQQNADFLEALIDACVMECYFPQEAAVQGLQQRVTQTLQATPPASQTATLLADQSLHQTLAVIPTTSPNLLAIIQQEGKV